MSTQGLSWWPGSCEGAQQTGVVSGINAHLARAMAFISQPSPFGHVSHLPLLCGRLFGRYWEWGSGAGILFHQPGRKLNCLKNLSDMERWGGGGLGVGGSGLMHAAWAWWVIPNWGAGTPFPTTELHYCGRESVHVPDLFGWKRSCKSLCGEELLSRRQTSWCGEHYPHIWGSWCGDS